MHDFVDECKKAGIEFKPDIMPYYTWHYRAFIRDILYYIYIFIHKLFPSLLKRRKAIIIAANGSTIKDIAFPYYFNYEIIPFLWDTWPNSHQKLFQDIIDFDIKYLFVSSSQVANIINKSTQANAKWIPEALTTTHYKNKLELDQRPYEVFEMGRQKAEYHNVLLKLLKEGHIHTLNTSNILHNGSLDNKNVAHTNQELYDIMANSRTIICFPRCDTNKEIAGNIETLTQRYWEAMLSGCLMIGRAPQELIDLIGYNPVIDVNWDEPEKQLQNILKHITEYQELANKNYQKAMEHASWGKRMPIIKTFLEEHNYTL